MLGWVYAPRLGTRSVGSAIAPLASRGVAGHESSFRHIGNSGGGDDPNRPFGIMQVAERWHADKFDAGVVRKTTLAENLDLGAQVVKECLYREHGNERRALRRYRGAPSPRQDTYILAVLRLRDDIQLALAD